MKTKALLIPIIGIVAGAMTFTACNQKVDEKTMTDVTQFGNDWNAMGEKASTWSTQLTETAHHAKDFASKQTDMMNTWMNSKDENMKMKMQEMTKTAMDNSTHLDAMVNEWNTWKTSWDENTKSYTEWQNKVMKGEVTPEDIQKGMTDWKNKMTEAQTKMDTWTTSYNSVKESCDRTMAASDEMSKSMSTPSHMSPKEKMKK